MLVDEFADFGEILARELIGFDEMDEERSQRPAGSGTKWHPRHSRRQPFRLALVIRFGE
jgi:hypothetical protein